MGKLVLKDASIVVSGVDLSNHCSKVTIQSQKNDVDVTGFGSDYKEIAQGLGDGSITLSVFQDYAAGSVDATLWPLHVSGGTFSVVVKPTSASPSATNPKYTMIGVLNNYNPIDGAVGDASTTDIVIQNADQSGIVRGTV